MAHPYREQLELTNLLTPVRRKGSGLPRTDFRVSYVLWMDLIDRLRQLVRSQYSGPTLAFGRAISTSIYEPEPEPTVAGAIQLWMAPLLQCFVYKRRSHEFHLVRQHSLLRDPVDVLQIDGSYRVEDTRSF